MATLRDEIERREEQRALVQQIIESEARLASGKGELKTLELETPQVNLLIAAAEQHAQSAGEIVDAIEASVSEIIAATDAITGAVMAIVVNLPETACDCPVCATKFGTPEAFRSRALAASDRLTPEIARQQALLAEARSRHEAALVECNRLRPLAWSRQRTHTDALERLRARIKAASNHTRDQVRDAATAKVQAWAKRSGVVTRTKNLAASASAEIETELNSFNSEFIRPLEKLMGRINRSILCDPTIGIEFTVHKNSVDQSAVKGTEIPKDRGSIDPRLVHSEGQMAALGVSLMCAASLTFPWSRWKAMVLDDPLQHNDAIHAAAFADFIGNLVLSRGYQVFLSTHELGQAEFLRRKFKARGIPCSLVSLIGAGEDGVETNIERAVPFGLGSDPSPDKPAAAG